MPLIEPVPSGSLPPESRAIIDDTFGEGLSATQVPPRAPCSAPGPGADPHPQCGECQPCVQSRKDGSITDEGVACTVHVLDAGKAHGMRRVVALSTGTFFDLTAPGFREDAPLRDDPPDDPYTVTKLEAFREVHRRAEAGDDVLTCHPGAIYGPGIVTERALHRTSFNRVLLAGMRGKLTAYLAFPVTWVAGADVAKGSIAALDRGKLGSKYWLMGRPEDEVSTAAGCNRACEIAGVPYRVEDLDHRTAPKEVLDMFGPTLYAIAEAAANEVRPPRTADNPTRDDLGYDPMSLDEGLGLLIPWLRDLGRLEPAPAP